MGNQLPAARTLYKTRKAPRLDIFGLIKWRRSAVLLLVLVALCLWQYQALVQDSDLSIAALSTLSLTRSSVEGNGRTSQARFTLNDKTIHFSESALAATTGEDDHDTKAFTILLTNYNWNQPNTTQGLQYARSTRQRELLQAVVRHPNFDSSVDWSRVLDQTYKLHSSKRYYIFLDVETCFESNHPIYSGASGFEINADSEGGRAVYPKTDAECYSLDRCPYIPHALNAIRSYPLAATLIVPECRGNGPPLNYRSKRQLSKQLSLASLSSEQSQLIANVDQGLPPPAVERVELSAVQIDDIYSCNTAKRPYLLSFIGNTNIKQGARVRKRLVRMLQQEPDMILFDRTEFLQQFTADDNKANKNSNNNRSNYFMDYIAQSQFSAVPRGDNLFSYRFTEVLSVGAIPVVLADGWVLPFMERLVDWTKCVVTIPEDQVLQLPDVLRSMSDEERCTRRKACFAFYQQYMATPEGTIQGILDGLELTRAYRTTNL